MLENYRDCPGCTGPNCAVCSGRAACDPRKCPVGVAAQCNSQQCATVNGKMRLLGGPRNPMIPNVGNQCAKGACLRRVLGNRSAQCSYTPEMSRMCHS